MTFNDVTQEMLWKLRMEIRLNSFYVHDYDNSFGLTALSVSDFFDSYVEYLGELAEEEFGKYYTLDDVFSFDNEDNLYNWWGCYEYFPFEIEKVEEEE